MDFPTQISQRNRAQQYLDIAGVMFLALDPEGRVTMINRETDKNLFFETRDHRRNDTWMHRNYLTK